MPKFIALTIDLSIMQVELTTQDVEDLQNGDAGFLDFDCHHIFYNDAEWQAFKKEVNQF